MQTYSLNNLAEQLERDRSTLVKAMRNIAPDALVKGRPSWKIATASRALEAHMRVQVGNSSERPGNDHTSHLAALYACFDSAYETMRKRKTVTARRKAAVAMAPLIEEMDRQVRQIGIANGCGEELTNLRADKLFRLYLRGFESCCGWDTVEVFKHLDCTADV
ncbi:MAG: hypothetical protein JWR89_5139 [Tardiphaga sp.]|uniref:hypothetical protein n=1 Tax=Tardiphaga sp. TaxID=1926292 RepID=UPI002611490E|nr:hypothetical protein [Tardiphaga sp.]MDB5505237.1 hypothetical protein [Tardiphaga sp.]